MKITDLGKVEKKAMGLEGARNVTKQVPISKLDGTPSFSFRVFTIAPEGHTPFHKHPFEHVNYVIDGEGCVVSEGGRERPVKKGDFVLVMPDEAHQYKNRAADRPLVIICAVPKEYE